MKAPCFLLLLADPVRLTRYMVMVVVVVEGGG